VHELNIFAINLIAFNLFCIFCYFLPQKVCSIALASTVALIIGVFVLPTLIYTYCFTIYKAKDAKVSLRISIDCRYYAVCS